MHTTPPLLPLSTLQVPGSPEFLEATPVEGISVVALTTMKWMPASTSQEDEINFFFKILSSVQPALPLVT